MERAQAPEAWVLGSLAEEMHLPIVPGALVDQPLALLMDLRAMRAYAQTKAQFDRAGSEGEIPKGYLADLVWEFTEERYFERRDADGAGNG